MRQIELTKGMSAVVDDEDFNVLVQYEWYFNGRYAARKNHKDNTTILMHRFIMDFPAIPFVVDHIDGNMLNNCRENLRIVTQSENIFNSKIYKHNKTGFRGVCFDNHAKKYKAHIRINGKSKHLGMYKTPEEASKVREKYLAEHLTAST